MRCKFGRWNIGVGVLALLVSLSSSAGADWEAGVAAYSAKDYATAVAEFEAVVQTNSGFAGGYYMLGNSLNGLGKTSQALPHLRKAVELDGANVSYRVAFGQTLLKAEQYNEAYTVLKAINASTVDAKFRTSFALVFAQAATKTNRAGEAVQVLTAQARVEPRNAQLQQALGVAYSAMGDDARALAAFGTAFDLDPKNQAVGREAVRAAIAAARRATSDQEKSRLYTAGGQAAEKLAAAASTFEHTLLAGEAWLGAKEYGKAVSWFDKAQGQKPQNALVFFYRGQAYSAMGLSDKAVSDLQQALKLQPNDKLRTQIYDNLGYVYDRQKDYDRAIQAYSAIGKTAKVEEMKRKQDAVAQNREADEERRRFENQVSALRMQIQELEKLGETDEVKALREQLAELEKHLKEMR